MPKKSETVEDIEKRMKELEHMRQRLLRFNAAMEKRYPHLFKDKPTTFHGSDDPLPPELL